MKRFVMQVVGVLAALALTGTAAADLVEGKDYSRLKIPHAVDSGKKIEVIEFFSYGCPHCNDLEPYLQAWMKTLPPDVQFRRVPVMFQDRWKALAKDYFTLEAMGEDVKLSPDLFKALHASGLPLYQDKAFSLGGEQNRPGEVVDTYSSFGIDSR